MTLNIRQKAAAAERDVANIHNYFFKDKKLKNSDGGILTLKRNLMQSAEGGYDLIGLSFLALEVKRQEILSLPAWWRQTTKQAACGQSPVLWFKQSRKPWRVILPVDIGLPPKPLTKDLLKSEVTIERYFKWLKGKIENER